MTVRRVLLVAVGVAVALLVAAGAVGGWAAGAVGGWAVGPAVAAGGAAAGGAAAGGAGSGGAGSGGAGSGGAGSGGAGSGGAGSGGAGWGGIAAGAARPVGLELPSIGVRAGLVALGLEPDGTVAVPALDSPDAGWFTGSPAPGERGPAVILGHVDSARTGPGVFFRLADLQPGDPVRVTGAGGGVVEFRVDRVERVAKAEFPTADVYGDLDHAGIRLITCGGVFDQGSYLDNVIVYGSVP